MAKLEVHSSAVQSLRPTCWVAAALGMMLLLAFVFSCSPKGKSAAAAGPPGEGSGQWLEFNISHGGLDRWFRVFRPAHLPRDADVVVLLHGGTQSMRKIFGPRSGGTREWRHVAEEKRFLLVVPNGTNPETGDTRGDRQNWNDVRIAADVGNPEVDDVGFIRKLFGWIRAEYPVDPRRFYVTGASNGGMMTYRLVMEMPEEIAAAAAFIANLPADGQRLRTPSRAVPLMICNGTEDPLVLWEGGEIMGGRGDMRSARQTVDWWVQANRASRTAAVTEDLPNADTTDNCRFIRTVYPPLAGGAVVEFVEMRGGGHALPSQAHPLPDNWLIRRVIGPVCRDAEGARLAWGFLKRHRLGE